MKTALISPEELATEFGEKVDRRKVIEWTRRYGWPHIKVGRTIAFLPEDVEQILMTHHVAGTKKHAPNVLEGQTALSAARAS